MIERGQSEAIQLVRDTVSTGNTTIPPMTYLDEEGLEEQFLTEDEATQDIADVTANRVTTPVEMTDTAPLDPIYTQRSQQEEELDLQPSRGPRSNSMLGVMEQFLDDNYEDILRTSNMQTDFSVITHNSAPCQVTAPLRWIVPDGTNRRLEEITDRKKADGTPGSGSSGSMVITLPRIEPYFGTQFFLVDIENGELFALIQQQWRRTGLTCAEQPFLITQLMEKVERRGQIMQAEIEAEQQTPLVSLQGSQGQFDAPPPLPAMDEPEVYVVHQDVMDTNMRKNYVRDRMRAALIYVSEYAETQKMLSEDRYRQEDLLVRLRAIFGRVDRVRSQIDQALQHDDAHRRRRDMRFLLLPTRFPRPESMGQSDVTVWTNWIREETTTVMDQLDEELEARGDPDDPFNGSANGIFQPLTTSLTLPPPVQTPNNRKDSKFREHSRKSPEKKRDTQERTNTSVTARQMEPKIHTQVPQREFREPSRNSRSPIDEAALPSRRNVQLHQMRGEEAIPAVENNLITFTPLPRNTQERGQQHPQQEPKEQRSHRRRVQDGTWRLNQKQFNTSGNQEISHISPVEQVNGFTIQEPSVSCLQLPMGKAADPRVCSKCGNPGHWRKYCQSTTWCRFCTSGTHATRACKRYSNFVKDNPIASSRRTTPEHPVRSQQGFPQPPTQRFQAPVIPSTEGSNQRVKQPRVQLNSQDVRMDLRFRHPPPHYSQIPLHRQIPPVEVNELGPTIQQGIIHRPKERTEGNIDGRLQTEVRNERLSEKNDGTNTTQSPCIRPNVRQHNTKMLPEGYQLALNETVRPVFVNHYYAGETVVPGTNRRYIKLDDCDVLSASVQGIHQTQAVEREFIEHSRESLPT